MTTIATNPARIVEIAGITAGIAVPEGGRLRFFSADRSFNSLDQHTYASLGQVNAAARACLERSQRRSPVRPRAEPAPARCDERCPRGPAMIGLLALDDHCAGA